jgi:hypothetical protein
MKEKKMSKLYLWGLLIVMVVGGFGCGATNSSTHSYFSPTWTRDGKVLLISSLQSSSKDALGTQVSSSYSEYVLTMYPSGTGESTPLFDATSARPYAMTCSPTGNYVAYGDSLRSGYFRTIVIRNISTEAHQGMDMLELALTGVKSFDWSANGLQIVYCTSTEVRVRDWNDFTGATDVLVTAEPTVGITLESVSWRYGGRIAFVRASGSNKLLSMIYSDRSERVDLSAALSVELPQISAVNTSEVYGIKNGTLVRVNVDAGTATTVVASGFTGELPCLAPDGKQLIYNKTGENSGIYLISDVTAASPTETKVK